MWACDRLQPTKRRFDSRARVLTHRVARMPSRAGIDRAAARSRQVLGDMRGGAQLARHINKLAHVVVLIASNGSATPRRTFPLRMQHQQSGIPFGATIRGRRHRVRNETVPILDQAVPSTAARCESSRRFGAIAPAAGVPAGPTAARSRHTVGQIRGTYRPARHQRSSYDDATNSGRALWSS